MRRSLLLASALLPVAAPLLAQEEDHGGGGSLLSVNPGLTIWTIIIFLLVLVILARFAYPKILGAVEAREAHLRQLAEEAERDRAEAAALLAENRRILEDTRARTQEALAESRTGAEAMRAQALEQARAEREEILARARQEIATERAVAMEQVRKDAVELALRAAERLVRRNLDGEDNRRLVREFLGQTEPARAGRAPAGV